MVGVRVPSLLCCLALIALVMGGPTLAHEGQAPPTDYIAGRLVAIHCGDSERTYLPEGEPDMDWPPDWLFSGEPECAPLDAYSQEGHAGGYGGAYICYGPTIASNGTVLNDCPNHIGDQATIQADDLIGSPLLEVQLRCAEGEPCIGPGSTIANCGTLVIPELVEPENSHFFYPTPPAFWVRIRDAHIDPVTLETCLGSVGTLTVQFD